MSGDQHPAQNPAAGKVEGKPVPAGQTAAWGPHQDFEAAGETVELSFPGIVADYEQTPEAVWSLHAGQAPRNNEPMIRSRIASRMGAKRTCRRSPLRLSRSTSATRLKRSPAA